jgi:hypothetical protein
MRQIIIMTSGATGRAEKAHQLGTHLALSLRPEDDCEQREA